MIFPAEIGEMLREYFIVDESVKHLTAIKEADYGFDSDRLEEINKKLMVRKWERDQVYFIMSEYFEWLPMGKVWEDIYETN